jgi:hypothetical protein
MNRPYNYYFLRAYSREMRGRSTLRVPDVRREASRPYN